MPEASVGTLVVPAAAALSGVLLGKAWDLFAGGVAWKRTQRATAYAAYIAAAEAVCIEMSQIAEDFSEKDVDNCVRELTRAGAVVDMFASVDVARAAHRLWNFVALDLNCHEIKEMTEDEWLPLSRAIRDLIGKFRDAARVDLGEKPLVTRTVDLDNSAGLPPAPEVPTRS